MPELPEVQTTVDGLNETVKGRRILDVWTDYNSPFYIGKDNVKNPLFFKKFKKEISGQKILRARRRGKNILVELAGKKTILIHMKMTGHLLFGKFKFKRSENTWAPMEKGPLADPFNRFLHLVFILSGGKHLAFSDMRKFATVTLIDTGEFGEDKELAHLGPDALEISFQKFSEIIKKPARPGGRSGGETRPIKQALMDQELIAGVGNIYSDEMLWLSSIHPSSIPSRIPLLALKNLYAAMKKVLRAGIDFGGDSMSDYRNIKGERGKFQEKHNAYQKTGSRCSKRLCFGTITRGLFGQRSGHFCPAHQKKYS